VANTRVNATALPSGDSAGNTLWPVGAILHVFPVASERTSIGPWQVGQTSAVW